ncbi:MAG: hypothetical protein R3B09_32340 [Nannocystaceae bacterium]
MIDADGRTRRRSSGVRIGPVTAARQAPQYPGVASQLRQVSIRDAGARWQIVQVPSPATRSSTGSQLAMPGAATPGGPASRITI